MKYPSVYMSIILIGDSVLDNFYWLEDKESDLRAELIKSGYHCDNFAVDEAQFSDVVNGMTPRNIYSENRSYPYPISDDGKVYPLDLLQNIKNKENSMVVLSVGGNDMRVSIGALLFGVDAFVDRFLSKNNVDLYEKAIETILKYSNKLVLVVTYIPCVSEMSIYKLLSHLADPIYSKWREFITKTAKKYNVAVLDLSETFDRYNREHYGSTVIEPSNLSNKCIARCLEHIYNNYKGFAVYDAPNCGEIREQ